MLSDAGDELTERGGRVVDDVVRPARSAKVQRGHRGGRGILVVDEGDLAPVADDGQHPSAKHGGDVVDVGTVEQPVTQGDALDSLGVRGLLLR